MDFRVPSPLLELLGVVICPPTSLPNSLAWAFGTRRTGAPVFGPLPVFLPLSPTFGLGIRSLGPAASPGCLFYGSTRRPWDIATTSWACLVALSVWCLWASTIGEPAPVCLRRTALGSGWHPATGHVRCWREQMAASRHKCYEELAKLAASDSLQEAVFSVMEDAE